MGVLQATSRRGITHLFDPHNSVIYRPYRTCVKALCGAEIKRNHLVGGINFPHGKPCQKCRAKAERHRGYWQQICAHYK